MLFENATFITKCVGTSVNRQYFFDKRYGQHPLEENLRLKSK